MKAKILQIIKNGTILLADGAMGTELQKRGLSSNDCPEEFNIKYPEIVQSIYRDYYHAGSDIVETNTFGGTRSRLAKYGLDKKVIEFSRRSAELARQVCPAAKFVAGSVGPTGEILEPLGPVSLREAYDLFAEQVEALAAGGVDIIFVETMMSIEEAETAVKATKERTNLPVSASMTFELTNSGVKTSWGVDPASAVTRLSAAGADIIGSNCGNGIEVIMEVIKAMRPLTNLPLIAQPNAGLPEIINGKIHYRQKPENIKDQILELLNYKISILGGCCGTNPEFIKFLRMLVDSRQKKS